MNSVGRFTKMMACGLAMAAMLALSTAEAATGKATVRTIRGTASYSEAGGEFKTLKVGKVLGEGAVVRTSAASVVDLYLAENGPTVRLTENTTLGLDRLFKDTAGSETIIETQLDLQSGTILGYVSKMAAASKYEVKTPMGVAGIRGTEYRISADGRIDVLSGTVLAVYMINGQAQTFTINAGQTLTPGNPPTVGPLSPAEQAEIRANMPPTDGGPGPGPGPAPIITTPEPNVVISPLTGVGAEEHST